MPAVDDLKVLESIALFEGMSHDEHHELNNLMHRKLFQSGSNIITVAQPGELVYLLLDGTVKIFVDQISGSEVILAFLGPGDTFGEMSMMDSSGRSANVVALEKTSCLSMDRQTFQRCLRKMNQLSYNLVTLLSRRLRLANEQIRALSTLDVRGRVARQLLAFAQQYGVADGVGGIRIPLRLTQTDVASLVGASRERVNQVIVDFKDGSFISVDASHRFTVHNPRALVERCQ